MTDHKTGTREEWLAARLELLKAEKDLCGAATSWRGSGRIAVGADRQEVSIRDREGARRWRPFPRPPQLIVYHFMFGYGFRLTDERRGASAAPLWPTTSTVSSPT